MAVPAFCADGFVACDDLSVRKLDRGMAVSTRDLNVNAVEGEGGVTVVIEHGLSPRASRFVATFARSTSVDMELSAMDIAVAARAILSGAAVETTGHDRCG